MEETALLPPQSPVRLEFKTNLLGRPAAVRARWSSLLAETDAIRRGLQFPHLPVGFEARLLALPEAPPSRAWLRRIAAAAAAAVLLVALVAVGRAEWTAHRTTVVADLAAKNHAHDTHVTMTTSDARELESGLSAALGFPVSLPELAPGTRIIGGRECALASAPVAYVALQSGDVECALYVFEAGALCLPGTMARRARTVRLDAGTTAIVDLWSHGGIGYALVSTSAHVLEPK